MTLDRSSRAAVGLLWLACIAVDAATFLLSRSLWAALTLAVPLLALCIWQTAFHMVPRRKRTGGELDVTSVADGKVVAVKKIPEREFLCRDSVMVSVYMDFWDLHANFWPVSGEVEYMMYHAGRHFLAFKPKASEENEHACMSVRTPGGDSVFFKLLAGGFARRISCYGAKGSRAVAGEQCGIIKFGSRVDIYLPADAEILVSPGDRVLACTTVIARLQPRG